MKKRIFTKAVAALCATLMTTSCSDIVVKVEKKPKNVDLSKVEALKDLNLGSSSEFLSHVDGLKTMAVDLLVTELANRDYGSEIRNSVRKYRTFLLERAAADYKMDDSFYKSAEQCRATGLSFNMDEANEFLGLTLKTAILAAISEASVGQLNPSLSKEIQAIAQIILKELGIQVKGNVTAVKNDDGSTTTSGDVMLRLLALENEAVDPEVLEADKSQILVISFDRTHGGDFVGTFEASIRMLDPKDDAKFDAMVKQDSGKDKGLEIVDADYDLLAGAHMTVSRSNLDGRFVHGIAVDISNANVKTYSRKMSFEQMKDKKHILLVTDTLNYDTEAAESYTTTIDVKEGQQCKLPAGGCGDDIGSEEFSDCEETPVEPTPAPVEEQKVDKPAPTQKPEDVKAPIDDDSDKPVPTGSTPCDDAKTDCPTQSVNQSPHQS